jgi:hypothetical protein
MVISAMSVLLSKKKRAKKNCINYLIFLQQQHLGIAALSLAYLPILMGWGMDGGTQLRFFFSE